MVGDRCHHLHPVRSGSGLAPGTTAGFFAVDHNHSKSCHSHDIAWREQRPIWQSARALQNCDAGQAEIVDHASIQQVQEADLSRVAKCLKGPSCVALNLRRFRIANGRANPCRQAAVTAPTVGAQHNWPYGERIGCRCGNGVSNPYSPEVAGPGP